MNADEAIARMRGPKNMHIICIDVTNKCDLACSNCTRLLENQSAFWEMSPDNFRTALRSLKGYWGVIAMIGGNPCMHRNFEELCAIFREEVPNKMQRGLWTNNYFKHQAVIEETFGTFNMNSHGQARAEGSLMDLHKKVQAQGALSWTYEGNSKHSSILTAVKDLYPESEMWERISGCDINREWSATIIQNKGELRVYFCEVAASFDLARGEDHGHPLTDGWWKNHVDAYGEQIKKFCPGCGVPARQGAKTDADEADVYTDTNADLALKSQREKNRKIERLQYVETEAGRVTRYNEVMS